MSDRRFVLFVASLMIVLPFVGYFVGLNEGSRKQKPTVRTTADDAKVLQEVYLYETDCLNRAARAGVVAGDDTLVYTLDSDRMAAFARYRGGVRLLYESRGETPPGWTSAD